MATMLYIGAGTDAFPLTCPELRKKFSRIIYTDRLPQKGHACPNTTSPMTRSVTKILAKLCDQGGYYANLKPESFAAQSDGSYVAKLPDQCMFIYYLNCDLVSNVPRDLLNDVTAIYIHGFPPPRRC